jgi:hypothetical protein
MPSSLAALTRALGKLAQIISAIEQLVGNESERLQVGLAYRCQKAPSAT